jgi:Glu-tRNA(Gln) amidotransferase subunit E-like FAD-binding protein
MKTAGATRHAERMERVPVWALDDAKIRELIERCYPGGKRKELAARMVRIVYAYYRTGATATKIAEALGMSVKAVEESLRRINKTMNRPIKPRGRPKKNAVGIKTDSVSPVL